MTPYGRRNLDDQRLATPQSLRPRVAGNQIRQRPWSVYIVGAVALAVILLFLILHLTGAIAGRH
jgi:hypothetical protein